MPFTREVDVTDQRIEVYPGFREDMGAVQDAREATSDGSIGVESLAWTAYVPVLTADAEATNLGSGGTITGSYVQIGSTVHFKGDILLGSTSLDIGSGTESFRITLPVSATDDDANIGSASGLDQGTAYRAGSLVQDTTDTFIIVSDGGAGPWRHDVPSAWAATDTIAWSGTYEAA